MPPQKGNDLYEAVCSQSSLMQLASEFLEDYEKDKESSFQELLNFIVQSFGVNLEINEDALRDPDTIPDAIGELEEQYRKKNVTVYPIIEKKSKFRQRYVEFWEKFVFNMKKSLLYDTEDELMNNLINWLASFSSSIMRPFRHTATLASITILTSLCRVMATATQEYKKLDLRRNNPKIKTRENLETAVEDLASKKTRLEELITDLFNGVFVHRYRDTDPHIRADCLKALGECIHLCPDHFLETQHLKYLGWMLYDKVTQVRHCSLQTLNGLFKPSFYTSLRALSERIKDRLLEIAASDKDGSCRIEAVKILEKINSAGYLEDTDYEKMAVLLMDVDPKIRKVVSSPIVEWTKSNFIECLTNECEEAQMDFSEDFVELKGICQMIVKVSDLVVEREREIVTLVKEQSTNEEVFELKEVKTSVEGQTLRTQVNSSLENWMLAMDDLPVTKTEHIENAVLCLLHEFPILLDFETMVSMLTQDSSKEEIVTLNDSENLILVHILSTSLGHVLSSDEKKKVDQEVVSKAKKCLVGNILGLLRKYSKEYTGNEYQCLIETLNITKMLKLTYIEEMGLTELFEQICEVVCDILMDHKSKVVFDLVAEILANFTGLGPEKTASDLTKHSQGCITRLVNVVDDCFIKLMAKVETVTEDFEKLSEDGLALLVQVKNGISRVHSLSSNLNLFDSEFVLFQEYAKVINAGLELTLQYLKASRESAETLDTKVDAIAAQIIQFSTEFLSVDLINLINQLSKTNLDNEVSRTELLELVRSRELALINLCEAIVCDQNGETFGIEFDIIQKYVSLTVLIDMFPVLNGNIVEKYPAIARPPLPEFHKNAFDVISQVYSLCKNGSFESVKASKCKAFGFELLAVFGGLAKMVVNQQLEFKNCGPIFQFYGLKPSLLNPSEENEHVEFGCFGKVYDGIADMVLNGAISKFANTVDDTYKETGNLETKLQFLSSQCDDINVMIGESVEKVVWALFTGTAPNHLAGESFASKLVSIMKDLISNLSSETFSKRITTFMGISPKLFIKRVHRLIHAKLLEVIERLLKQNINLIQEWFNVVERSPEDIDITFQTSFINAESKFQREQKVLKHFADANQSWKLLKIITGSFAGMISLLEVEEDELDRQTLAEIIVTVEKTLEDTNLNQDPSEDNWALFEECLEATKNGQTTVLKPTKKISSTKQKSTKKRKLKFKPEEDSDLDARSDKTEKAPKRQSRRLSDKAKIIKYEETSDIETDKENINRPLLATTPTPTKKRLNDSEDEIEFQDSPAVTSKKRARA